FPYILLKYHCFSQGKDFINSEVFFLASSIVIPFSHSFSKSKGTVSFFWIFLICSRITGLSMELIHLIISFFSTAISIFSYLLSKLTNIYFFLKIRNFLIYENAFTAPSLQST